MDKIKRMKGINNPYKKLCLVDNEQVRVETLKEVSKFFWIDLKTKKRPKTLVDNIFYKNEELKILLSKSSITPEENKKIFEEIEKDIKNLQNDLWYKQKTEDLSNKKIKEHKSLTWMNIRKHFKEKIFVPVGKKTFDFIKNHKIKVLVATWLIISSSYISFSNVNNLKNIWYAEKNTVLEYQENQPNNILHIPRNLEWEDYVQFVKNISNMKLDRSLKIDVNNSEFQDFDKLYGKYMSKLQEMPKWRMWIELTQEEWKTFLVMQYIATNSYVDYLKSIWDDLKWPELQKNEYDIARYVSQLNSIEKSINDLEWSHEWEQKRHIKSGNNYYTYYTNYNNSFLIDWLDNRKFVY